MAPQRRRTHAPGALLGVAAAAGGDAGAARNGAPPRTRGTGSWHAPTPGRPRHSAGATGSWTAASSIQRGSARRGSGRLVALIALLVAVGGVGTLALAGLGGGSGSPKKAIARSTARATPPATHTRSRATHRPAPATATTRASTTTPTTPVAPTPPSAEQLQATGHSELAAGNYPQAIATLRKALATADPGSLTYAYGLYDLGLALLKSGNPAAAVPVLEQRIKIPNQTATVKAALDQALQASGQAPTPSPPAAGHGKGKGKAKGHGKGPGASGGAGLSPNPPGPGTEHPNFVD